MLKFILFALVCLLSANILAQSQTDNSAAARAFIEAFTKKDFASAYNYFSDEAKSQVTVEAMPQIWAQITGKYGDFQSIKEIKEVSGGKALLAALEFKNETVKFAFTFNQQGKILGFSLVPSETANKNAKYETPNYADTNLFEEKEVRVGAGEWALPATLTMPKGKTNVPAIVLVHGSGANDRDESHINSSNKVFKDLAWGLASKGIAVLRYEKRNRQYPKEFAEIKNLTVNEETVDDALLAVQLLRQTPNVNIKNIFVLGHSLGGMMIPRIGQRDTKIAGLISFAGTARPLEDVIVEQYTYLFSLNGAPSAAVQKQLDEIKQLAEKTKNLKPADSPDTPTVLNLPVSYWADLNSYHPTTVAKTLKQPMLILQGESDYQVTMKDFQLWKDALSNRKDVSFKTYPNLTHIFMEGLGGKPNPSDYEKTNHVNAQVIGDIAEWILKTSKN